MESEYTRFLLHGSSRFKRLPVAKPASDSWGEGPSIVTEESRLDNYTNLLNMNRNINYCGSDSRIGSISASPVTSESTLTQPILASYLLVAERPPTTTGFKTAVTGDSGRMELCQDHVSPNFFTHNLLILLSLSIIPHGVL